MTTAERQLEDHLVEKLRGLTYHYGPDIRDREARLQARETFNPDKGSPVISNYTLINIQKWCKNILEAANQLRISAENSHHRFDVMPWISRVPVVQFEFRALDISRGRAMRQISECTSAPDTNNACPGAWHSNRVWNSRINDIEPPRRT